MSTRTWNASNHPHGKTPSVLHELLLFVCFKLSYRMKVTFKLSKRLSVFLVLVRGDRLYRGQIIRLVVIL
jgi:hypothetical protein